MTSRRPTDRPRGRFATDRRRSNERPSRRGPGGRRGEPLGAGAVSG